MSNNKQSMKLYTEEQLTAAYFMGNMDGFLNNKDYSISERFEPIELPSDEEIEEQGNLITDLRMRSIYMLGAKWMRDKIQGGNK